jgi:prepilin signal peptidase PulO-like enzyme (type II secretory pathway)
VNWISVYPLPYGLLVAMVTGLLGASFFMMIQLQQRISEGTLADARDMWTTPLLVLRCIVGIGAATILYFFFKSGLLQGRKRPDTASRLPRCPLPPLTSGLLTSGPGNGW